MAAADTKHDGQLLAEFVASRNEQPFEEVVRRHGTMVFNACYRILEDRDDAEDAAQAVFLTLSHKASGLTGRKSVAGWLHHVARNVARNAKRANELRRRREREAGIMTHDPSAMTDRARADLRAEIDDAVESLPAKYRLPVVLFHLEGHSLDETADLLESNRGTVGSRLARGREMLRERLLRRGVVVPVVGLVGWLSQEGCAAAAPVAFAETTAKAAGLIAAGEAAGGLVSAQSAALTQGALHMLFMAKMKALGTVLAASLVAMIVLGGITSAALSSGPSPQAKAATEALPPGEVVPEPAVPVGDTQPVDTEPANTKPAGSPEPEPPRRVLGKIEAGQPTYRHRPHEAWQDKGRVVGRLRNAPPCEIDVLDPSGNIVKSARVESGSDAYELEWLAPGIYTFHVSAKEYHPLILEGLEVRARHDLFMDLEFTPAGAR